MKKTAAAMVANAAAATLKAQHCTSTTTTAAAAASDADDDETTVDVLVCESGYPRSTEMGYDPLVVVLMIACDLHLNLRFLND